MPNGQFDIARRTQPFDVEAQRLAGEKYLGRYTQAISQLPSPATTLEQYQGRYGVPQLQAQVGQLGEIGEMLGAQVRGMPAQVAGTTRESLVTEPQRAGMVQAQQQPILEQLGEVTRGLAVAQPALTAAQQQAGQMAGLEIGRQEMALLPFERGFSLLEQRQAREFSGYTFANEQELNRLIANQQAGITLSEGEEDRLNQLAIAEKGYENQLAQIRATGEEERLTKRAPKSLSEIFEDMFPD